MTPLRDWVKTANAVGRLALANDMNKIKSFAEYPLLLASSCNKFAKASLRTLLFVPSLASSFSSSISLS